MNGEVRRGDEMAGMGAVGIPESRNVSGMMPVSSPPSFMTIGGPYSDHWFATRKNAQINDL